ncbi:MAG: NAD(P)-binding domain-containing protein [Thermoleophilia bacterium]|nr:NAD(P)-binding domain-containing protein [Thermoleophilia bacterium]
MSDNGGKRVCVIGAGSSGITACQNLLERGIEFDCFEKSSEVGGNWRYENDNGMSAAYESLHINTSRGMMEYGAFPMPGHLPDYPNHFQIADYFDDYVDHFGIREKIKFKTEVKSVVPVDGGSWEVTVKSKKGKTRTETYTDVMVCNGHHWDSRWPEPAFPGSDEFEGEQMHAHDYRTPDILKGKRVLVLGIGNSATDIAVESSRIADTTFLAMRRGAWILPKYLGSTPTDRAMSGPMSRAPLAVQSFFLKRSLRMTVGKLTDFGLPEPDHEPLHAHPTVSSDLVPRLGHGDIKVKPNIDHFDGDRVVFTDGSSEQIDLVIYCTGYRITFPFFDEEVISTEDNQVDLYRRVASIGHPGLYFIGLIQPLGAIMPLAEAQSAWVADLIEGRCSLPDRSSMARAVALEQARMKRRYVTSKRHTIQVDFDDYLRTVEKERKEPRTPGVAA